MIADMAAGMVAMDHGAKGPNFAVVSACASGSHAIGEAAEWIRRGDATAVLAGGTEGAVTPIELASFAAMQALSTRNDDPERASRPFDKDRDGFVMGEGAGIVVLEEYEHARRRGAPIYAEVVGYGATADAYAHHPARARVATAPGAAWPRALQRAGRTRRRGRLHQRARHLDPAQRLRRDPRDQGRLRSRGGRHADVVDASR